MFHSAKVIIKRCACVAVLWECTVEITESHGKMAPSHYLYRRRLKLISMAYWRSREREAPKVISSSMFSRQC